MEDGEKSQTDVTEYSYLDEDVWLVDEEEMDSVMKKMIKKYEMYKMEMIKSNENVGLLNFLVFEYYYIVLQMKKLDLEKIDLELMDTMDEETKNSIGVHVLKTSKEYYRKKDRDTVLSKYKQILDCRRKVSQVLQK